MRYWILLLFISLPIFAGAAVLSSVNQGETAIVQQDIPYRFAPKKHRFFERFVEKTIHKRIKKALKRNDGEAEKWLSILGLSVSILGISLIFATTALIAGLVLTLGGLVLSIVGLVISSSATRKWVKGLAIAGIVLSSLVILVFLAFLIVLITVFS